MEAVAMNLFHLLKLNCVRNCWIQTLSWESWGAIYAVLACLAV